MSASASGTPQGLRGSSRQPFMEELRKYLPALSLLFSALYAVGLFNTKFFLGDEGIATLGAWRISLGQVPYLDFFEIVPPASFLPLALAFKLFGVSVLVERAVVFSLALCLLFTADRLLRFFTTDWRARCLVAVTLGPFGVSYWPLPSHHWFADLFQLLALIALLAALRGGRPGSMGFTAGALSALACFSLQDQGAYFLLALALLFFPWVPDAARRRALLLSWVCGGLAVGGLFVVWLLPRTGWAPLWDQWLVFPVSRYKQITGNEGSFFAGWSGVLDVWTTGLAAHRPLYALASFISWSFVFCLPFLSLPLLLHAGWKKLLPFSEFGLLLSAWVAFFTTALHRWSLTNLIWAAPAFLIPLAWRLARSLSSESRGQRVLARIAFVLFAVGLVSYAGLLLLDSRGASSYPVRSRAGTLRSLVPEESAVLQEAVTAVEAHVPEGTPLFTTGYIPLVNFLTLTPPATRYNYFMYPAYHTDAQMEEVLRTVESRRTPFALLVKPLSADSRLDSYFLKKYRPIWSNPLVVLVERLPEEGVPPGPDQRGRGTTTAR